MTNYNERLDEILDRVLSQETSREGGYAEYYADDTEYRESLPYGNPLANQGELKQAILDWHNKQVEELLDKFEQDCKLNYTTWGNSERMLQVSGVLKRIEAERNKPKERDDGQL